MILEAAEKRLQELGPDGLRLQQIAADVGVSHPAILHHFGSREALLQQVVQNALERLERDLLRSLSSAGLGDVQAAADMLQRAFRVFVDGGHARVVAWLILSGHHVKPDANRIRAIAQAVHARRAERQPGANDFEDTLFRTLLVALTLFAEGIVGEVMFSSAGLTGDGSATRRFHDWLARLLADDGLERR